MDCPLKAEHLTPDARVTPDKLLANAHELKFLPPKVFELGLRVQRWFDAQWNAPDLAMLDELATPDFTFYTEVGTVRGLNEMKERVREFHRSFSEFAMIAEEVCDLGGALAVRWMVSMTHTGPWIDLAPTGRRVTVRGSAWARLDQGRFCEAWDFWDPSVIYAQLLDVGD